jgi:hypothetical protein
MRRLPLVLRGVARQCTSLAALVALGCTGLPGAEARRLAALDREAGELATALAAGGAPAGADALRVRLAFGAAADLDLYVTDPAAETVYFANTASQSGGALERDVRCEDPAPRVETVTFPAAPPGRYRVGVDYPQPCGADADPVAFAVSVEHRGTQREQRGVARPGRFEVIVVEFELPGVLTPASAPR